VYALRSLIAAAAAAVAIVFCSAIFFLNSLTCSSVTIGAPGAPRPARNSEPQPLTSRQDGGRPAKVVVVGLQK